MTRLEKAARARVLRDRGMLLREIAEEMGVAKQTVHDWLHDPDGSKLRARKDSYRGTCETCGARTDGSSGRTAAPTECASCYAQRHHDERRWTPETVIDAIRSFAAKYGRAPGTADWLSGRGVTDARRDRFHRDDCWPCVETVKRECGSWNAALRMAGLEPNREFNRPLAADPTVVDRAAAMYLSGKTLTEAGEAFGVSSTRVAQWLDKIGVSRRSRWGSRDPHADRAAA